MARPKGNRESTERRKLEMIQAAFEAFSKDGYNGTSLKSIAEAVEVTEAALLHHYKSKAGLMWAVLDYRDERTNTSFAQSISAGKHRAAIWIDIIRENQTNRGIVELFSKLSAEATNPEHPAHSYFLRRHFMVQDAVSELFQVLRDDGQLASTLKPTQLALELTCLSDGLQIAWLMNPNIDMVAIQIDFFRDCMTETGFEEAFGPMKPSSAK